MRHRLVAIVHGRVQGVGYRRFAERRAGECGVSALPWNRPDGTVEVRAEGSRAALEALLAALRAGPPAARVDRVDEIWTDAGEAERKRGRS